jgi:hypothetical protein
MFHRSEKVLQIAVYDPLLSVLNFSPHLTHGVLGGPPSPISKVGIIEYRLEDWFQPIEQRLLAYPVIYRRDSQRTKLTRFPGLRNLHLPYRLWLIGFLLQFALQPIQLLIKLRRELFQCLPIHASTAPIGPYTLPGDL